MKALTSKFFMALPVVAAVLSVTPASASPVTIGTVDPTVYVLADQGTFSGGYSTNNYVTPGSTFTDVYSFEVPSSSGLNSAVTNNSFVWGDFTVNLTGLSDKIMLGNTVVATSASDGTLFANLIANKIYNLVVTGTIDGNAGGTYTVGYSVSAVPVPGAFLLFGSGLIGLAGFARRGRKTAA